jgi:hypothetical protein
MARSTYIYVAMDSHDIVTLGTVKREVIALVRNHYSHIVTEIRRYYDAGDVSYSLVEPKEWATEHLSG